MKPSSVPDPAASNLLSVENASECTSPVLPGRISRSRGFLSLKSHRRMAPSIPAEASRSRFGEKATAITQPPWPRSTHSRVGGAGPLGGMISRFRGTAAGVTFTTAVDGGFSSDEAAPGRATWGELPDANGARASATSIGTKIHTST